MDNDPEIIVLFDGYSKDATTHTLANCTCTLIKSQKNIIIDTMTSWDGNKLTKALLEKNVHCRDLDYVICTHGHSDHIGCNYLFPNALHIVGFCISKGEKYYDHDFKSGKEYIINKFIKIIPTPGHTLQDISVIVTKNNNEVVAITGDLFENEQDLSDDEIWKSAGSDSQMLQEQNRKKILDIATYIIPGHGPMFKVQK